MGNEAARGLEFRPYRKHSEGFFAAAPPGTSLDRAKAAALVAAPNLQPASPGSERRRQSRALSVRPTRVVTVRLLAGAEALQGPLGGLDGLGAELAEKLGGDRPPAGADVGER